MNRFPPFLIISFFLSLTLSVQARHIVGGEIRMEATAVTNRFTVTMVQFWDENTLTTGNRDGSAELLFYRKRDNQLMLKYTLPYISSRTVSYQNQACASFRSLSTTEGTYRSSILLNPADFSDPDGYYIVWERCCRNDDVNNILLPGSSGMVFYLEFPPLNVLNSSPVFSFPNGDYICKDQEFKMNMSAIDNDGDELRYSLVTPMQGNTNRNNPLGNDAQKSGYPLVNWTSGITLQNIIPGNPSLGISSQGGILRVVASQIGLYVFTVQCEEYRDGKRLGLVRRDFQLLVIECSKNTPPTPVILYDNTEVKSLEFCPERPIQLNTASAPNWSYQWQLNGQNILGAVGSSLMVSDTGWYSVVKSFKDQCSKDTSSLAVSLVKGTKPEATIISDKIVICKDETILLRANSGANLVYEWKKGQEILKENGQILPISEAESYLLKVENRTNGCSTLDSIIIKKETISVSLPQISSVLRGNSVRLEPIVESSAYPIKYNWSPVVSISSSTDSIISVNPIETLDYIIQVTSPVGCLASDTITITVFDRMYIPDAFSPNGDGINDRLIIQNGELQIKKIQIFNRWGEVVYASTGYSIPWDGLYLSEKLPNGIYIYKIKTSYHTYEGTIVILY
jgi:gliding motility-associated-like protein